MRIVLAENGFGKQIRSWFTLAASGYKKIFNIADFLIDTL